jgi:DNA-directed RNA polymerase specialized sigma24 family protein
MKKNWLLSQESFDALLDWLDRDREQAGHKYEEIRQRLITIFTCRKCHEADLLADETINRVTSKLGDVKPEFTGDPARYFYAVANKVYLENQRSKPPQPPPLSAVDSKLVETEYACLEECLGKLSDENRELVLEYYREEGIAKIENRRQLSERLGIGPNALRIRAFRIRASLLDCVKRCVERSEG